MENPISRLAILKVNLFELYALGSNSLTNQQAMVTSIKFMYDDCVDKSSPPPGKGDMVFLDSISIDYDMYYPNKCRLVFRTKDKYVVELECVNYEPILQFIPETPAALVLFT